MIFNYKYFYYNNYNRVNALIKYGFNKDVQNPDGSHSPVNPQPSGESLLASPIAYPQQSWEDISTAFSSLKGVLQFNTSHIVTYFVNRSVSDGLPASDFKSVNNSAEYLFRCGHVQAILFCSNEKYLFIKAKCLPEMRKDRVYLLNMALIRPGCDIVSAECGCPAGKGPQGSCKHVGALSYALSDICRIQVLPQYHTCTDQLQQWNQPCDSYNLKMSSFVVLVV